MQTSNKACERNKWKNDSYFTYPPLIILIEINSNQRSWHKTSIPLVDPSQNNGTTKIGKDKVNLTAIISPLDHRRWLEPVKNVPIDSKNLPIFTSILTTPTASDEYYLKGESKPTCSVLQMLVSLIFVLPKQTWDGEKWGKFICLTSLRFWAFEGKRQEEETNQQLLLTRLDSNQQVGGRKCKTSDRGRTKDGSSRRRERDIDWLDERERER